MAGLSATYLSVDSFAVSGDYTDHLLADRAVLCDCGVDGEKKRIIESSSFGAGATTVTLVTDATRNLTSNLDTIQWSLVKSGSTSSILLHGHEDDDDGGLVSGAPAAHKDRHDPEDGEDPLDCAAAGEIVGVAAAAEGSAHSFARSDHTHQLQHSIADDHVVTIDSADVQNNDFARFTANGLEGLSYAEVMAILSGAAISAFSFNSQNITNVGTVDGVDVSEHAHTGGSDGVTLGQAALTVNYTRQLLWYLDGDAAVDTNISAEITYRGPTLTLVRVDARCKTAPTSAALIFDINVGGTTIWSTQANRVQIAASATSGTQTSFDTTTISDGDVITLDIDQIGSGDPGESMTVILEGICNLEDD